jgi:hypothetical protein
MMDKREDRTEERGEEIKVRERRGERTIEKIET